MYSAPYGYPNPAGGPTFNGAPPQQNPHLQPGPSPGQPQQMMYNPQQFPMGAQGGHFPAAPNPAMMGGAGPAGMMQNTGMPHMGANGQSKLPLFICLSLPPPSHTHHPVSSALPSLLLVLRTDLSPPPSSHLPRRDALARSTRAGADPLTPCRGAGAVVWLTSFRPSLPWASSIPLASQKTDMIRIDSGLPDALYGLALWSGRPVRCGGTTSSASRELHDG